MEKEFKVGVIGAGNRIYEMLNGVNQVREMRVAAVADPCAESVERVFSRLSYRPEVCDSNAALLARGDLDGVIVATPNDTHAEIAKLVLDSGLPLYLEKPMATTVVDCEAVAEHAQKTGGKMMVGMQLRYADVYEKMKRLVDDGAVGEVKLLLFRALRSRFRGGVDGWRMQKKRSGGMILEVSVHQMDLFNWFAGAPVKKISGFGGRDAIYQNEELLDNALVMAEYQNGVKANLQAAVFAPQGADNAGLCVVGTEGTAYHTQDEIIVKLGNGDVNTYSTTGYAAMDANAMRGFMAYVRDGVPPRTSPEAGRDAVRLGILAEKAIEDGVVLTV